jgi:hypothetical protein
MATALLALGGWGAQSAPLTWGAVVWPLAGTLVGLVLLALLGRESVRQRRRQVWSEYEDDDPVFFWRH